MCDKLGGDAYYDYVVYYRSELCDKLGADAYTLTMLYIAEVSCVISWEQMPIL